MKVVLDTNVLISGIFFSGFPAELLRAWRRGDVEFVLSPEILDEYLRVAGILSDKYGGVGIGPIIDLIASHSDIVQPPDPSGRLCDDPDDDKFIACAVASGSAVIISGDRHLLNVSGHAGLSVMTPRAFVERYLQKTR